MKITDEDKKEIECADDFHLTIGEDNDHDLPNIKDFFFSKLKIISDDDSWIDEVDGLLSTMKKYVKDNAHFKEENVYIFKELRKNMVDFVPIAPAVKNWMRYKFFANLGLKKEIEDHIFGTIKPISKKKASKISISGAYNKKNYWEFRIWGWIPENNSIFSNKVERADFIKDLKKALDPPQSKLTKALPDTAAR